jgi:hypothetical protein
MAFYDSIIKLLNRAYSIAEYLNALVKAVGMHLDKIYAQLLVFKNNLFFDLLNEEGCDWWEKLLYIEKASTLADRRSRIKAKWNSNNHNCIDLIQMCCNAWKNGETKADFLNGKIVIQFVGNYGVPTDLDGLKVAIEEIKPAHLPYLFKFKYLLIENIHEVMTIEDMEKLTIDMFAFDNQEK